MLSLESQTVLDILRDLTGGDDVYKIIDADEILEKLPSVVKLTKIQLSQLIKDLKDREYINVKYFTPDEYCLLTLKRIEQKANTSQAEVAPDKRERELYGNVKQPKNKGVKSGIIFLMSLLGSLLGSSVVAAVATVIIKFVL